MNSVAILITCHCRLLKTIKCVDSIYKSDLPAFVIVDIFLVDDGSTDGTGNAIKEKFPSVNVIYGDGNLYWNRGMHLSWETAISKKKYDYYLWLNDDTILFENALSIMLSKAEETLGESILVGATCSEKSGEITYTGYKYYNNRLFPNGEWQLCDFFNGNIVLVPSYVYQIVGNLDHRFHHALGDFDYGMRATKKEINSFLSPVPLGFCEPHEHDPIWRNKTYSLKKRIVHLYSPLGNNPFEFFIFDRRRTGIVMACLHFLTIHIRTIFPYLWKYNNTN